VDLGCKGKGATQSVQFVIFKIYKIIILADKNFLQYCGIISLYGAPTVEKVLKILLGYAFHMEGRKPIPLENLNPRIGAKK